MSNERIRTKLQGLLAAGHLPGSACSKEFREFARPLFDAQVLREERSGGGRKLAVMDRAALQHFHDHHFPGTIGTEHAPARVRSVGSFRNTKALKNDAPHIVHARVGATSPISFTHATMADPVRSTREQGLFTFLLGREPGPLLTGRWVLIENPALFFHHGQVFGPETSAILTNGIAPKRLLNWLHGQDPARVQLLHAPDYDPIGLKEYLRLCNKLGDRLELFVPDGIAQLLERYGNPDLVKPARQQGALRSVAAAPYGAVRRLHALLVKHGAGLEQEALLLPP
jgi:hypothetical protein